MGGWILMSALVVAMGTLGGRMVRRRLISRRARRALGRSPAKPWELASFHELNTGIGASRCHCGGQLHVLGEGSRSTPHGELRVVRSECVVCEDEVDIFFRVAELRH